MFSNKAFYIITLFYFWYFKLAEPPKLIVNEKRYGRKSKPDVSISEDQYSADEESSFLESQIESQAGDITPLPHDPPIRDFPEVLFMVNDQLKFKCKKNGSDLSNKLV